MSADESQSEADRQARIDVLEEENRRLREAYRRARQTRYRRVAAGLGLVGLVALVGAALFPTVRAVLIVLGATGLFGGLLTWYLTPERFVAASVGERVYAALAENEATLAAELGLDDRLRYVPLPDDHDQSAALYLGRSGVDELPPPAELDSRFVVTDAHRGLSLVPTGAPLLSELRAATPRGLATDPSAVVDQLVEGLREQFELIDTAEVDVDAGRGRASIAVTGSTLGDLDRFDHAVGSLLAAGLAIALSTPVELTVDRTPDGRGDYLITAEWDAEKISQEPDENGSEP